jgi:serine/threonine protein kinase/thioredoxin-like negative regulator of GroEL
MAQVWLAERADGAFKREVALKLPMISGLRKDLAARFAHERDILAGLEHPNIARLYDAGVSPNGLPFLAMEYVPGQPITNWCEDNALGVRERLQLFLQVLDAVQYAHEHQVIHRDIKPSNILVTEAGEVRLLDFGVAKLLADDGSRAQLTQVYGAALTPDYASPEQLRGQSVGAASDIYSLGVVLYELLAGQRPYTMKRGGSALMLERSITLAQVRKPSTVLKADATTSRTPATEKLARRLRGDLDLIVLKALAKEPSERYDSAASLAEDLRRHLSGDPVEAHAPALGYRLGKFILRHRSGTLTAVLGVLALATIAMLLLDQKHLSDTSARAQAAAAVVPEKSIAVLPFADMSEKKDQEYFSDGLSEELIDHLSRAPGLKVISRTSSFYFKGKQATISEIGKSLRVSHILEGSVRKSGNTLRINAQLVDARDGTQLWSQTYDRKLREVFKVQDEIAGTVAQALNVVMKTAGGGAGKPANTEAYNLVLRGKFFLQRDTKPDLEQAIALFKQSLALEPHYALAHAGLGQAYASQVFLGLRPVPEGIALAKASLRQALQTDPELVWAHATLADIHLQIDWDWAATEAELAHIRNVDPINADVLPRAMANVSWVFGRLDQTIATYRQLLANDPLDDSLLMQMGTVLFHARRFEESISVFQQLLQMNPNHGAVASAVALDLLFLGRKNEALASVQKEPSGNLRADVLTIVYWALGRHSESDAVLAGLKRDFADVDAYNIACAYAYRGEPDEAMDWLQRAYDTRDPGLANIKVDPLLQSLHGNPRYMAMLRKLKLVDGGNPGATSGT